MLKNIVTENDPKLTDKTKWNKRTKTWVLAGVAHLVGALSHEPEVSGFDSQSGHIPKM